jgi:soluble lytic murein transglycosylase
MNNKSQRWVISLAAVVVIAGCVPSEPIYIIVTGQPPTPDVAVDNVAVGGDTPNIAQMMPTETTALQPQPTAIPTLNAPVEQILAQARGYQINGFYENAVTAYSDILAQGESLPADARATAAFQLGISALREGLFHQSAQAMTLFIDQFASDPRVGQAYFLRGDAYLGLGRWVEAVNDFSRYLELRPGLIDSYAYERIGDGLLALGQTEAAISNYQRAADASRSLVPQLALRERVAQALIGAGRPRDAIPQYDAILAVAVNAPYRANIELAAAQALLAGGDLENAMLRFQRILTDYTIQAAAYTAASELAERGIPVDNGLRGRAAFAFGDYPGAIIAINAHTTETASTEIDPEYYLLLGRAYREIGNSTAALTAFQTIIDQYSTTPQFGQALLEQGRTRFLNGDIPAAIAFYENIARTYDYLPEAPEALWRAGYLYSTNDQPAQGRAIFEQLATLHPNSEQAVSGLLLAAGAALNTGDARGAERLYFEVAAQTTGEDQANALLSAGRLALTRGDSTMGIDALTRAASAAPDSYFSARARDIVDGTAPFQPPGAVNLQIDDEQTQTAAEDWLRQTFALDVTGDLATLPPQMANDPRMIRGTELWTVGAVDEARAEFSDMVDENQTDPLASYQLALYLRELTAYQNSIVAASYIIRTANIGTLEAPPFIARLRYPAYYADVVLASGQRHGVDPLLLLSLIRHESLFDRYATAAAGEKGLTQVIPSTGEYIAVQLQFPDYQHTDLFRPYAAVEFGAYYLGENLRTLDGSVTAALSGYNAGPGRAITWRDLSGGEHDAFISTITIDSTRIYVQRIYGYYTIYRALYGG